VLYDNGNTKSGTTAEESVVCSVRNVTTVNIQAIKGPNVSRGEHPIWVGTIQTDDGYFQCTENCICDGGSCGVLDETNYIAAFANYRLPAQKTTCSGGNICVLSYVMRGISYRMNRELY